jgi:hypothetical protein
MTIFTTTEELPQNYLLVGSIPVNIASPNTKSLSKSIIVVELVSVILASKRLADDGIVLLRLVTHIGHIFLHMKYE